MEHLTYISYVHQNEKGNNVQCVINVRVTYLVYVLKRDIIVMVHLTYITYVHRN